MTDRPLLSAELLEPTKQANVAEDTGRAFLHSLIQSPLNGAVQIVDKVADCNILPKVQFIQPPRHAEFGTLNWHAQQVGQAAGMVPWFVGLHKCSSALLRSATGAELKSAAGLAAEQGLLSRKTALDLGSSALTGFTYGGLLTPSRPDEDLLPSRLRTAGSTALTITALTGSTRVIESMGVRNRVLSGALSGGPTGLVAAESNSLLDGKGWASTRDVAQSIYSFTLIGGAFGYLQGRAERANKAAELSLKSQFNETMPRLLEPVKPTQPTPTELQTLQMKSLGVNPLRLKAPETPVDWSLAADLRTELSSGEPPAKPLDLLRGHELVYRSQGELNLDKIAVRQRGDTVATSSQRSGTIVLERPGQPWTAELADGRRITMESPGPWEVATPSQRVIIKSAGGETTIRSWGGRVLQTIPKPEASH